MTDIKITISVPVEAAASAGMNVAAGDAPTPMALAQLQGVVSTEAGSTGAPTPMALEQVAALAGTGQGGVPSPMPMEELQGSQSSDKEGESRPKGSRSK